MTWKIKKQNVISKSNVNAMYKVMQLSLENLYG